MGENERYIPALGVHWLTPFYDPLLRWLMREERFKRRLIAEATIQPGHRVLDLGCGTGTLTILIKQLCPAAEVTGLDVDAQVLGLARAKAGRAGVEVAFHRGPAYKLPYVDGAFDRVLSSLVFHHLTAHEKRGAFREVFRVLRPDGELHLVDFGPPRSLYARLLFPFANRVEETSENVQGLLPEMMAAAGFERVVEPAYFTTVVGDLSHYRGEKPVRKRAPERSVSPLLDL